VGWCLTGSCQKDPVVGWCLTGSCQKDPVVGWCLTGSSNRRILLCPSLSRCSSLPMSRSCLTDFEVLSRLGAGSFGTVYKVQRHADQQHYVVKTVRIAELSYKEQNEAINEVQILAQLESPYVVRYFDSFIENDSLHIGNNDMTGF
jgi:serine/threonine protein kinase